MATEQAWTKDRHEAALARCEAATPGPWYDARYFDTDRNGPHIETRDEINVALCSIGAKEHDANGAFIAAVREDVPAMLAEIERAWAEIEALQQDVAGLRVQIEYRASPEGISEHQQAIRGAVAYLRGPFDPPMSDRECQALDVLEKEIEQGWATIAEQAGVIESASAVLTALGHADKGKSLAQRITESHEENMRSVRSAHDAATRRVLHAHDAANALYQAAKRVSDEWNDDDPSMLTRESMAALRAALDDEQATAALREVQRRDRLDGQIAKLGAEVQGLRREREELLNKLRHSEAREARPALTEEEAIRWFDRLQAEKRDLHEAAQPSGLMLNLDPVPHVGQSTAEILEHFYRSWEALAAHDGMPIEPRDIVHLRRADMTIGCGEQRPNEGATSIPEHVTCERLGCVAGSPGETGTDDTERPPPPMHPDPTTGKEWRVTGELEHPDFGLLPILDFVPVTSPPVEMAVTVGDACPGCHGDCIGWVVDGRACDGDSQ